MDRVALFSATLSSFAMTWACVLPRSTVLLVLLCFNGCSAALVEKETHAMETLTGRYSFVPSPCITTPCLPGMAYAIHSGESDYYLTVSGRWFSENRGWNGYTPAVGDSVTATGEVRRRKDAREQTS
jgi:hypothetical protein